jgi:hypothetical protein
MGAGEEGLKMQRAQWRDVFSVHSGYKRQMTKSAHQYVKITESAH